MLPPAGSPRKALMFGSSVGRVTRHLDKPACDEAIRAHTDGRHVVTTQQHHGRGRPLPRLAPSGEHRDEFGWQPGGLVLHDAATHLRHHHEGTPVVRVVDDHGLVGD